MHACAHRQTHPPTHPLLCCRAIAVLGVDFMSENVRAILDEAGHKDVKVGRQGRTGL